MLGRLRCRYCDQSLARAEQWKFKLPSPSRQAIVNWVAEGFSYSPSHPEMIEKSFSVCGITTRMSMKKFMKKDYLKNARKIHSTICYLFACILFYRNKCLLWQYKFSFLSSLFNKLFNNNIFIVPSQRAGKTFLLNIFCS